MKIVDTVLLLVELAVDYTLDTILRRAIGERKGAEKVVTRIGSLIISAAAGDIIMRQGYKMVADALPENAESSQTEDHADEAPDEVDIDNFDKEAM